MSFTDVPIRRPILGKALSKETSFDAPDSVKNTHERPSLINLSRSNSTRKSFINTQEKRNPASRILSFQSQPSERKKSSFVGADSIGLLMQRKKSSFVGADSIGLLMQRKKSLFINAPDTEALIAESRRKKSLIGRAKSTSKQDSVSSSRGEIKRRKSFDSSGSEFSAGSLKLDESSSNFRTESSEMETPRSEIRQ